jgi:hypothetical protein
VRVQPGRSILRVFAVLSVSACDSRAQGAAAITDGAALAAPTVTLATLIPAPPPYDPASDVRSRVETARAELGGDVRVVVERGVFVFVGRDAGSRYDAAVRLARQALEAYFNERFSKAPARTVLIYLLSSRSALESFCAKHLAGGCPKEAGVYLRAAREMAIDLSFGTATLTHELVHPIVQSDFPMAPTWLDEGLGALYENPVLPRAGEIHGATNWRRDELVAALGSKSAADKTRLTALFEMPDADFRATDEDLHYAMARELCRWLDSRGQLWPFYRAWRDAVAEGVASTSAEDGERVFAKVVGKRPADAQAEWITWVRTRQ